MNSCCYICETGIITKSDKRKDFSICVNCFNNREKTITNCEAELSGIDKKLMTKLYYMNYVMYSKKEYESLSYEGLTHGDILILKESKYVKEDYNYRLKLMHQFSKKNSIEFYILSSDKYVDAFLTYGLINKDTDKEFFDDVIERLTSI